MDIIFYYLNIWHLKTTFFEAGFDTKILHGFLKTKSFHPVSYTTEYQCYVKQGLSRPDIPIPLQPLFLIEYSHNFIAEKPSMY